MIKQIEQLEGDLMASWPSPQLAGRVIKQIQQLGGYDASYSCSCEIQKIMFWFWGPGRGAASQGNFGVWKMCTHGYVT